MLEIEISARARSDLKEIFDYTEEKWGESQAVRYAQAFDACWRRLAQNPGLGISCESLKPGLLRFATQRHVTYFEISEGLLTIIRILHTAQDPDPVFGSSLQE